jgi:hypothetical protein
MKPLDLAFDRTTSADAVTESARPYRGRRLSWAEFFRERPDLKPDNDNSTRQDKAA